MTPRVLEREFEAARLRSIDRYRENVTQAWNVARFNAATKSKQGLAPLSRYLDDIKDGDSSPAQSPQAMLATVQMMSGMYGIPMRRAKE